MKENNKLNILNKDERFKNTKYDNLIVQFSKKYSNNHKIDPALIKIIVRKESKFNPNARS
ncbi:transglycosylase SLT domain-containing protein [bacterium]|nr:transglycosylase SLT domain-containing protein [bacterium]